jgi:hypothetical protein
MPASLMAAASAAPKLWRTPTTTWRFAKQNCNELPATTAASSSPMACLAWMAILPPWTKFATWRTNGCILLMVDDAHGEGVLGEGGRGIVDHFGLTRPCRCRSRHAQQSVWRDGRIGRRPAKNYRLAAAAWTAVPLLQRHDRTRRGRLPRSRQRPPRIHRTGRQTLGQRPDAQRSPARLRL